MTDGIALIRSIGALLTVLGLLAGALWAVRRYNLVLPGTGLVRPDKRLAVIERLSLDPRRSLALLRRDGVEHLVLLAPEGHLVIETSIPGEVRTVATMQPAEFAAQGAIPAATLLANAGESFGALVERARLSIVASPKILIEGYRSIGQRQRANARG